MTTTDSVDPSPTPPAAAPAQNPFSRIAGVLFAPASTFQDIAARPNIWAPLIVILLIGYVGTFLVMPKINMNAIFEQQAEAMAKQNPNMAAEDRERMENITKGFTKAMMWAGPVMMVVWYVIVAAVLLLATRMFGGQGNFKQSFSATLYAWMPLVILSIIGTIVVLARGSFDPTTAATLVKSNPAFLVDMKEQPILYSLLSSFDLFTIWTLVLLIIGFSALSRLSRGKTAAIVISLWVLVLVIKLGFAALGAARMNA